MSANAKLYMVTIEVGDVPKAFYQEHGPRDIAYMRGLIDAGTVVEAVVTTNRRTMWLLMRAADEAEINRIVDAIPLRPYLTVEHKEALNLGAQVRSGQFGPPRT